MVSDVVRIHPEKALIFAVPVMVPVTGQTLVLSQDTPKRPMESQVLPGKFL